MAPVVYLQHSIAHRKSFYSILKFVIEHLAAVVKILVIHTDRQYEMQEFPYRDSLAPWHLGTRFQRIVDIVQMKFGSIVRYVGEWHIGIHELH